MKAEGLTIDEAITHAEQVADRCPGEDRQCAYQHDQLADWLRELKAYRASGLTAEQVQKVATDLKGKQIEEPMDMKAVIQDLMECFPLGIINHNLEFIADPRPRLNSYFRLEDCVTLTDVKCKVLSWLSRPAYKSEPFKAHHLNDEVHRYHLDGINDFLGTEFSESDIEEIYTYLGNGCNSNLTRKFVESGYDMKLILDPEVRRSLTWRG